MSIVLPSSEVNQLAGATATELAGSVLSAGSSEPENPEVSGSCPWASTDVSSLTTSVASLAQSLSTLAETVSTLSQDVEAIKQALPPTAPSGDTALVSTTTNALVTAIANAVWGRDSNATGDAATERTLTTQISGGGLTNDEKATLSKIFAFLANWRTLSINGQHRLYVYPDNSSTGIEYRMTKDTNGNITRIEPEPVSQSE